MRSSSQCDGQCVVCIIQAILKPKELTFVRYAPYYRRSCFLHAIFIDEYIALLHLCCCARRVYEKRQLFRFKMESPQRELAAQYPNRSVRMSPPTLKIIIGVLLVAAVDSTKSPTLRANLRFGA
jgi:hypothetical protein